MNIIIGTITGALVGTGAFYGGTPHPWDWLIAGMSSAIVIFCLGEATR